MADAAPRGRGGFGSRGEQRVEVDLLHGSDLAGLDETAELGDGLPLLLLLLVQ
jgi:hypothetical protein